jgi:hypothetical protein
MQGGIMAQQRVTITDVARAAGVSSCYSFGGHQQQKNMRLSS